MSRFTREAQAVIDAANEELKKCQEGINQAVARLASLPEPRPDPKDVEIERLTLENWQLKGALGYPVPANIPEGEFKCGLCDARRREIDLEILRRHGRGR